MDKEYLIKRFDRLLSFFPEDISRALEGLEPEIKMLAEEIRLRAGRPLTMTLGNSQFFVLEKGTSMLPKEGCIMVTADQVEQSFINMCNRSVYSHSNELSEGFIMLPGGHRAGVCGTVTLNEKNINSVRDISSINLRIAKEAVSCAEKAIKNYNSEGILVCGAPGTGKTTLIRDMVRRLAGGSLGRCYKVAVIDSRGEIAAVANGVPTADLGSTSDVITACPKGKGIEMALRTLYPDVIVFDELGDMEEVRAIEQSMNCGVPVITSAHVGSLNDLYKREQTKSLLKTGAVKKIILCRKENGFDYQVFSKEEVDETALCEL